jgi:hypothetical protein
MSGVNVQRMKLRDRRSESRMLAMKEKKAKKEKVIRRRPESTSAVSQDDYQI